MKFFISSAYIDFALYITMQHLLETFMHFSFKISVFIFHKLFWYFAVVLNHNCEHIEGQADIIFMNIFNILNVSHVGIITTLENFKLSKKSLISLNRKFIFSPTNNWFQTTITLLGNNLQILGFCHILSSVSAEISNIAKLQFQFLNPFILAHRKLNWDRNFWCGLWTLLILNA